MIQALIKVQKPAYLLYNFQLLCFDQEHCMPCPLGPGGCYRHARYLTASLCVNRTGWHVFGSEHNRKAPLQKQPCATSTCQEMAAPGHPDQMQEDRWVGSRQKIT